MCPIERTVAGLVRRPGLKNIFLMPVGLAPRGDPTLYEERRTVEPWSVRRFDSLGVASAPFTLKDVGSIPTEQERDSAFQGVKER